MRALPPALPCSRSSANALVVTFLAAKFLVLGRSRSRSVAFGGGTIVRQSKIDLPFFLHHFDELYAYLIADTEPAAFALRAIGTAALNQRVMGLVKFVISRKFPNVDESFRSGGDFDKNSEVGDAGNDTVEFFAHLVL